MDDPEGSGWLARLATPGALAYSSAFSLMQLGLVLEYKDRVDNLWWPVAATACYLPLHLHHVYWAVRGARPPAGGWTLAALATIVAATVPLAGINWLPIFAVVAVSAVLVLPWPWSLLVAAGVAGAQAPLALALDSPIGGAPSYYVVTVWWRAASLFVPIWMLGSIRQLQAIRRSLAEEAVVRERLRIDRELYTTVGAALDAIAARGQRALALAEARGASAGAADGDGEAGADTDTDGRTAAAEVQELVDGSRRALAEARQLVNRYRQPTLAAELETAAVLLRAAGIETRLELPGQDLPRPADEAVRSALRTATADVLDDGGIRACVIAVTGEDGQLQVEVRPVDDEVPAP